MSGLGWGPLVCGKSSKYTDDFFVHHKRKKTLIELLFSFFFAQKTLPNIQNECISLFTFAIIVIWLFLTCESGNWTKICQRISLLVAFLYNCARRDGKRGTKKNLLHTNFIHDSRWRTSAFFAYWCQWFSAAKNHANHCSL